MIQALFRVFRSPLSWALAVSIALAVFLGATLASNIMVAWDFILSPAISWEAKAKLLFFLSSSIRTNFPLLAAVSTIILAILFGINAALFVFYIRTRTSGANKLQLGTGIGGLISGVLGMGCAACGSVLLFPLLSTIGAGSLLTFLPLGGEEFSLLGVALLVASVSILLKQISNPVVCPVE